MPAESDFAVGFGEPDTFTGSYVAGTVTHRAVNDWAAAYPPAPSVGIEAHSRPDAPGWSSAATAIHSMRRMEKPVLLFLEAGGSAPLVLDFEHNVFMWNQSLDMLPSSPTSVAVSTRPVLPGDRPICPLPGP